MTVTFLGVLPFVCRGADYGQIELSHARGAEDSKNFLSSYNKEFNIISHSKTMTSKAFVCASRPTFLCASSKTNILAKMSY